MSARRRTCTSTPPPSPLPPSRPLRTVSPLFVPSTHSCARAPTQNQSERRIGTLKGSRGGSGECGWKEGRRERGRERDRAREREGEEVNIDSKPEWEEDRDPEGQQRRERGVWLEGTREGGREAERWER